MNLLTMQLATEQESSGTPPPTLSTVMSRRILTAVTSSRKLECSIVICCHEGL
jgi:hypothetical protein